MSLKTRVSFSSTMDKELMDKLKQFSADKKVPLSKLLDAAVEALFLHVEQNSRGTQRVPQKQDNMYIEESSEPYRIEIGLPDSNK